MYYDIDFDAINKGQSGYEYESSTDLDMNPVTKFVYIVCRKIVKKEGDGEIDSL